MIWAKTYLKQAGLIESPKRGVFRLSKEGAELLQRPPERIDVKFLSQYPAFRAFLQRSQAVTKSEPLDVANQPVSSVLTILS